MKFHRLLKRQLKKFSFDIENKEVNKGLIEAINEAYLSYDRDYSALERTLELSLEESFRELSNYKYAIEQSSIVSITDVNGNIIYVNKHFENISGYRLNEIKNKKIDIIRTEQYGLDFFSKIGEKLITGSIWNGEISNTAKNGSIFWLSTTIIPIKNEKVIQSYLTISYDITERVKTDELLSKSEKEYRTVVNSVPEIIFKTDVFGTFTFLNNSWEKIIGIPILEALDNKVYNYLDKYDKEFVKNFFSKIETFKEGDVLQREFKARTYDNSIIYIEVISTPIFNEKNKISGISGTITDITKSRQALAKIQELTKAMESAADGFAIIDLNGKYEYMNDSYSNQLGYTKSELKNKYWRDLYTDHTKIMYDKEIKKAILEKGYWIGESNGKRKDGKIVSQDLTITLLDNGKLVCNCKDNSARKEQENKLLKYSRNLERTNKELDQFAYIVSHDLKAPLRAINNLSTWIGEDLEGIIEGDVKAQFQLLRGRVHRMEGLIQGILEYSRAGRIVNKVEKVNINHLLNEIKDSLGLTGNSILELQPNFPIICSEKILLQQIFSNLISNSYKYNDKEKKLVKVSFEKQKNNKYLFTVEDNGIGIEEEYLDKIFVIFQTLHARDKVESTGVGLAIVKKIIQDKNEDITVESELNKGTKISFTWEESKAISVSKKEKIDLI